MMKTLLYSNAFFIKLFKILIYSRSSDNMACVVL